MQYNQLFRKLREDKGLTIEALAKRAACHRNTVINVESGRPVKVRTITELILKMGYASTGDEMESVVLAWAEAVSGIPFTKPGVLAAARKAVVRFQAPDKLAAKHLEAAVEEEGLDASEIGLLVYAARHSDVRNVVRAVRDLTGRLVEDQDEALPKAAEGPPKGGPGT